MSVARLICAASAGLVLAMLPFVHYMAIGGSPSAHADHEPHYGGQLGMVGDHHIEVRRQRGLVDVFVSDAWRRPVRPRHGWLSFAGASVQPLVWEQHHLIGSDRSGATTIGIHIILDDGTQLATSFDFSEDGAGGTR